MTPSPDNIQQLFLKIVALPRAEREAALNRECGDQPEARQRVAALLAAHDEPGRIVDGSEAPMDAPTNPQSKATADYSPIVEAGVTIADRYTLRERIGEGGMGEVWVASQSEPVKRRVALKLIKTGLDSRAVLKRFEQERQALAMMDHPNIARVLDGGMTRAGQPFFVMELVNGLPLNRFCDEATLTLNERLEIFVRICQAVQHAHHKGIVHRDLKPANILVTMIDGRPVPKVIDFGVAKATAGKLTDQTMSTGFGAVIGTLEYMSPEQAAFSNVDVDTRADIYSLGVILYELLTGLRPIDARRLKQAALTEMIRIIQEEEPSRPSARLSSDESLPSLAAARHIEPKKLTALLRGELDWIVMKCLEKQRDRRYETANALARDVQHYLQNEPVEARPPTASYRLRKYVRRHQAQVIAASVVLCALLVGMAGTTWGLLEARRQEQLARDETAEKERARAAEAEQVRQTYAAMQREAERADELRYRLGIGSMALASAALDKRDVALADERLEEVPVEQRGWDWHYMKRQSRGGILTLTGHRGPVTGVAFSPDAKWIVTAGGASGKPFEALVWDARTGEFLFELSGLPPVQGFNGVPLLSVAFSPDGTRILTGGGESTAAVWDVRTRRILLHLNAQKSMSAAFSPDGTRIAIGDANGSVKVWDAQSGSLQLELDGSNIGHVHRVAYSPDGKRIVGCDFRTAHVWDSEQGGAALFVLEGHLVTQCVAFSPDGTKIITGGVDGIVRAWDLRDGTPVPEWGELKHHTDALQEFQLGWSGLMSASFSPDGSRIVTGGGTGRMGEAKVWDARTKEELLELTGHRSLVSSAAFSPDGTRIITGSLDGTAKVWDARMGAHWVELKGDSRAGSAVTGVAFSPDGTRVVTASGAMDWPIFDQNKGPVTVWVSDARTGEALLALKRPRGLVQCVQFSPDGKQIVTGGWEPDPFLFTEGGWPKLHGHATVWDARTGAALLELQGFKEGVYSMAFSPDGKRIITGGVHDSPSSGATEVKVFDARTGAVLLDLGVPVRSLGMNLSARGVSVAFSPDGTRIVIAGMRDQIRSVDSAKVCDAQTGAVLFDLIGQWWPIQGAAFSPDGTRIVTCDRRRARVWDIRMGTAVELFKLTGHTGDVNGVAFSPDGTRIVTGSGDRTVRVWDAQTGSPLVELKAHIGHIMSVAFSSDGTRIVAGGRGEVGQTAKAMVWDAPPMGNDPLVLQGHIDYVASASFSPDGTRFVTGSRDRTVRVWDGRTGSVLLELKGFQEAVASVAFSPDGNRIITTEEGNVVHGGESEVRVWDVLTGQEVKGETIPQTVSNLRISPDGKLFALVGSDFTGQDELLVRLISLAPDAEEFAYRLIHTEPNVDRYLQGYLEARAAKDDFAVEYHRKLVLNLAPAEGEALIAKAEMNALANLVAWHLQEGKHDQAQPLLVEVMNLAKTQLGPENPETLESMNQLGRYYRDSGQFDKSVALFEELLKTREAQLGLQDPDTLVAMNQLGDVYRQMGQFEKSARLYEELLKIVEAESGQDHPHTLHAMRHLGVIYRDLGRLQEAILLLEQVQRTEKENESVVHELIDAYTRAGEHAKSVSLLLNQLAEVRQSLDANPLREHEVVHIQARLGMVYLEQKMWAEAEPHLRECLAYHERAMPDVFPTFSVQSMLGGALLGQGKYAEAEPLLLGAYEGMKQAVNSIPPEEETRLTQSVQWLVSLYETRKAPGDSEAATRWKTELERRQAADRTDVATQSMHEANNLPSAPPDN